MNDNVHAHDVVNPIVVDEDVTDDEHGRPEENPENLNQNGESPQLLSSSPHSHPPGNATLGETLAPDVVTPLPAAPRPRFDNSAQQRHWNFTFNNPSKADENQIRSILDNDKVLPKKKHIALWPTRLENKELPIFRVASILKKCNDSKQSSSSSDATHRVSI